MRTKKQKTAPEAVTEALDTATEEHEIDPAPQSMSVRERIKMAHALATVVEDPEIIKVIKSRPHGEYVVRLLTEAVERRLSELTGGASEEESAAASSLLETLESAETVVIRLLRGVQAATQGKNLPQQQTRATRKIPAYEDEFERPVINRVTGKPDYYQPDDEGDMA